MGTEFIELYKPWQEKKVKYPVGLQQKFDGVPVRFMNVGGNIVGYSRQGEQFLSLGHLIPHAQCLLLELGSSFVGELYVPGLPFADISGLARQHKCSPALQCYVFDFDIQNTPSEQWVVRHRQFTIALGTYLSASGMAARDCPVKLVPTVVCHNAEQVANAWDVIKAAYAKAEGAVGHSLAKPFQPGTRRWDTQKLKPRPTLDLRIVGFKEAISADGDLLGMVGRIEAEYTSLGRDGMAHTQVIGVGPGSLTHHERRNLWDWYKMVGRDFSLLGPTVVGSGIAEVGYMQDENYNMLREATFIRWRFDKRHAETHHKHGEA